MCENWFLFFILIGMIMIILTSQSTEENYYI